MIAILPGAWSEFFLTAAGAAAALAGLIIVALSANLKEILRFKSLPEQAAASIAALVLILVSSIAGLIPEQNLPSFGLEILAFSVVAWALQLRANYQFASVTPKRPIALIVGNVTLGQSQILPFLISGGLLLGSDANGLGWLACGIVLIFIVSMLNTWALLVEVRR